MSNIERPRLTEIGRHNATNGKTCKHCSSYRTGRDLSILTPYFSKSAYGHEHTLDSYWQLQLLKCRSGTAPDKERAIHADATFVQMADRLREMSMLAVSCFQRTADTLPPAAVVQILAASQLYIEDDNMAQTAASLDDRDC